MINRIKGFTLLEVSIAVSIIGIVFVSLFRMHAGNIKMMEYEKFYSIAPLLAAKQLALIETDIMSYDNQSNDFNEPYQGYKWECEIRDIAFSSSDGATQVLHSDSIQHFKEIVLQISGYSQEHIYTIRTWRYCANQ